MPSPILEGQFTSQVILKEETGQNLNLSDTLLEDRNQIGKVFIVIKIEKLFIPDENGERLSLLRERIAEIRRLAGGYPDELFPTDRDG